MSIVSDHFSGPGRAVSVVCVCAQIITFKRGIERVQALADIVCSALCCHTGHSNESHTPIANVPNSAQLEGAPYHSLNLHPRPCRNVARHKQTDTRDQYTFRVVYDSHKM